MRRVEIKNRGSVLPCRIFNYLGEDENKIFCKDDLGRVHILNKKLADMRFLDPPEEPANKLIDLEEKIAKLKGDFERAIVELTNRNEKLKKRVIDLEELCKAGDLYKVKALDINYGDLSCGFNELTKKVEKLELDNKAFKNAFANLGIPVHPACVQERTFTEEREIGSHGIKYLARKVGELEDKLSKLSTGLDKVYKELSEEIEKLSACVSSELTEEVNNEKK